MGLPGHPRALPPLSSAVPRQVHQTLAPTFCLQAEPDKTEGHQYRKNADQGLGWSVHSIVCSDEIETAGGV